MAALDDTKVKEGVDQETVDAVREMAGTYKHGWEPISRWITPPRG